jgi:hypothetical protein
LPPLEGVERATIELTTVADDHALAGPATLAVSCNACRGDWDLDTAAWAFASPGKPWNANELDAGGDFISMTIPRHVIGRQQAIVWDVTKVLQTAQAEKRDSLSLLVRVDNTGKYIAGKGYSFHGCDAAAVDFRPRLNVILRTK